MHTLSACAFPLLALRSVLNGLPRVPIPFPSAATYKRKMLSVLKANKALVRALAAARAEMAELKAAASRWGKNEDLYLPIVWDSLLSPLWAILSAENLCPFCMRVFVYACQGVAEKLCDSSCFSLFLEIEGFPLQCSSSGHYSPIKMLFLLLVTAAKELYRSNFSLLNAIRSTERTPFQFIF